MFRYIVLPIFVYLIYVSKGFNTYCSIDGIFKMIDIILVTNFWFIMLLVFDVHARDCNNKPADSICVISSMGKIANNFIQSLLCGQKG